MSRTQKILIAVAVAVVVCLFAVGILVGVVVSGWKAATRAGNEAATIQNLKTIAAAETQYFNAHNRSFGSFAQLLSENLLSAKFAGDPVNADGYVLVLSLTPRTAKLDSSFAVAADPQSSSSGTKHFYLDSGSGQIHVNNDGPAGPDDPLLNQ